MEAFELCGWPAYAAVGGSLLGVLVALVALGLAIFKPRFGLALAVVAIAVALLPAGCGVGGTAYGRHRIDRVLDGDSIDPTQKERIREMGYAEASESTPIGLVATAPPLVIAALALPIAFLRRRRDSAEQLRA